MAKSQTRDTRALLERGGDFIEAVYILDILKIVGRIEGLISLSRYGAVIRADTRSLYGLYFDSIEPPSFATFALLSRRQTVEIDKIRERGERKGVTYLAQLTRWKRDVNKVASVLGFYTPR